MALIKCPECGKEVSDKANSCPNCGYKISGGKSDKGYFKLAVFGAVLSLAGIFGIPLYKLGGILCVLSLVLSFTKKKKNENANIKITLIIGVLGVILCSFNIVTHDIIGNIQHSAAMKDSIVFDGIFELNPETSKEISENSLEKDESYVIVVYDLKNVTNTNVNISSFDDSVQLLFGDNEYNQLGSYLYKDELYTNFVMASGYKVSMDLNELKGGTTDPIRMIATFAVNNNDLQNVDKGSIRWKLSSNYRTEKEINTNDIKQISMFDDIFEVEDNSEEYQIAHSLYSRAKATEYYVNGAVSRITSSDFSGATLNLQMAQKMFKEGMWVATSNDGGRLSSDAPTYNSNAIKNELPDIYDTAKNLEQYVNECVDTWSSIQKNPTEDKVATFNNEIEAIRNLSNKIEEYFEK